MRRFAVALLATGLVCLPGAHAAHAAKAKRYGIEGKIVRYDDAKDLLVVEVTRTKVSGGFGTGRVAGGPPPDSVKSGNEIPFRVVPEGSVLRRTVIKSRKGGGLNNGTRESFERAVAAIPTDRSVVFSFEKDPKDGSDWVLKMIQIRMTQEELEERLEEISVEE